MRGAHRLEVAVAAEESGLGSEISGANLITHFRDRLSRLRERLLIARRAHRFIRGQIVKNQPHRIQLQNFPRCERVYAQLQALIRLFFVLVFARLVIHDLHLVRADTIHLIHSARDDDVVLQR